MSKQDIPMLKGWDFKDNEIQEALKNNLMLMLDTETSNLCNLWCLYCYRAEYGKQGKKVLWKEFDLNERKDLVDQAKDLRCRTIKIVGAGEPLIDKFFWFHVEYIHDVGITPVIFTNGIGLTKEDAMRLYDLDVSIIIKMNSLDEKIEDKIVGRKGYAKERDKALNNLISVGFNKSNPTRLGVDAVITKLNKDDIIKTFEFCRNNNIFPEFKSFIPTGASIKLKHWEVSKEELMKIFTEAKRIDKEKHGLEYDVTLPYIGGFPCKQLHFAMFVNILGEVYPCPGSRQLLGNIREKNLKDIWNGNKMKRIRNTTYNSCLPREEYWSNSKL